MHKKVGMSWGRANVQTSFVQIDNLVQKANGPGGGHRRVSSAICTPFKCLIYKQEIFILLPSLTVAL